MAAAQTGSNGAWPRTKPCFLLCDLRDFNGPEQPVRPAIRSGREVELGRSGGRFGAEGDRPETVDGDWIARGIAQRSLIGPVRIEAIDPSVAEVGDEDPGSGRPEIEWRARDSPRQIERPVRCEALDEVSFGGKDVDEPLPRTRVLRRIGHEQIAVDGRDTEGRIAGGHRGVDEVAFEFHGVELRIEHVDRTRKRIRRIQVRAGIRRRDRAVQGREKEHRALLGRHGFFRCGSVASALTAPSETRLTCL